MSEPFDAYALIDVSKCPEPLQQAIHNLVMEYFEVKSLTSSSIIEGDSIARVDFSDPTNPRYLSHEAQYYTADAMHFTPEGAKALRERARVIVEMDGTMQAATLNDYAPGTPEHAAFLEGMHYAATNEFNDGVGRAEMAICEWLEDNGFTDAAAALDASDVTDGVVYKPANHSAPVVEE